jgi:glycosyltransferase involved in cell wall biosynthesis
MATSMKVLLAISWAMPPMLFPRSVQVSRTLMALARQEWEITVVCGDPQSTPYVDPSLEKLYAGSYKTIRVSNAQAIDVSPDLLMRQWLKPAVSEIKTLLKRGERFPAMLTFAQPWVDHLIGLEVRKFARMPWIAHFSDPWVGSLYYAGFGKKLLKSWQKMEKDVIQQADMVLFTNSQAVDLVMQKYPPAWKEKVRVIPHGYDSSLVKSIGPSPASGSRLRLIYTGDLYGKRTPRGLFQALSSLSQRMSLQDQIEIVFVGRTSPEHQQLASELGIIDNVTFHDQVPYIQSLEAAAEADVLVVIDAPSSTPSPFLPSKLVDYLMFKKPILGLTPQDGASADLLRRLGCPVVAPGDPMAIAGALSSLLESWRKGNLTVSPDYEEIAQFYDIHRVGRLFEEALIQVIDREV